MENDLLSLWMGVNYHDYEWGCLIITRGGERLTITKDGGRLTISMVIASSRDLDALWGLENFWFRAANLCMPRERFQSFHQLLKGVSDSILDQTTLMYYRYYDADFRARWTLCQAVKWWLRTQPSKHRCLRCDSGSFLRHLTRLSAHCFWGPSVSFTQRCGASLWIENVEHLALGKYFLSGSCCC